MIKLVKLWDGLKFNDPKVFAIVSLIANILVNTLMYFATYGAEESRPLFFTLTSILTLLLNNIGVRTTRFIQNDATMDAPVDEVIQETVENIHVDTVANDVLIKEAKEHDNSTK